MPAPTAPAAHLPTRGTGICEGQAAGLPDGAGAAAGRERRGPGCAGGESPEEPRPAPGAETPGDGGWFAAGGIADGLVPGPRLAGFLAAAGAIGLGRLTDDELIGVLRAARRQASWSAAVELAAVGDLWRRRWAEEQAGDTGAAEHADEEIAAALTLTGRAADQMLGLAVALRRLPLTTQALTAGDIDLPRAMVIADAVTGLSNEHAAAVEQAVIGKAAGQTTGQLRAAAHRAVLSADPGAARERKERALAQARVERWEEPGGTAALAGRDLPPASVLAADSNLTALARQLRAAGAPGTLDHLRAHAYLALLTGRSVDSLIPTSPGPAADAPAESPTGSPTGCAGDAPARTTPPGSGPPAEPRASGGPGVPTDPGSPASTGTTPGSPASPGTTAGPGTATGPADPATPSASASPGTAAATAADSAGPASPGTSGTFAGPGSPGTPADLGTVGAFYGSGTVNLTMPLASWLGLSDAPGTAAGFGPLDVDDSRALADALTAQASTRWCLTLTDSHGRPVAHGCARTGPPPAQRPRNQPTAPPGTQKTRSRGAPANTTGDRSANSPGDRPAGSPGDSPADGPSDRSAQSPRDGPDTHAPGQPERRASDRTWTFSLAFLAGGACDHASETAAYRPSPGLRHLVEIRHATCTYPGCRRPATRCDTDHTLAYHHGGRTCLCNLAPLCRRHHRAKQAPGWHLSQDQPGIMTWQLPSGRTYTTCAEPYPV